MLNSPEDYEDVVAQTMKLLPNAIAEARHFHGSDPICVLSRMALAALQAKQTGALFQLVVEPNLAGLLAIVIQIGNATILAEEARQRLRAEKN